MNDWGDELLPREGHSGRPGLDALLGKARRGDLDAVLDALTHDPSLRQAKSLGHNRTLVWEATRGNRQVLLNHLLGTGADFDVPGRIRGECAVLLTPYAVARRRGRDDLARTLLGVGAQLDVYTACVLGEFDVVHSLIESDPDLVTREQDDDTFWRVTPLHHAVAGGHDDLVRLLLDRGAQVRPYTRLLCDIAARSDRGDLVEVLVQAGADPELACEWGKR
ncbi:MAG: ankyrin repeat domain-containing protein [Planctomycetes bacterium]|nr:ankyrin repeat domain-containing protein [Planctomycetota bacterium]